MTPTTEEQRAEFEAHISSLATDEAKLAVWLAHWPDGQYKHLNVQCMWDGWQAATAAAERRSPQPAAEGVEALNQAKEAIEWLCLHLERDHRCLHMSPSASGIPAWINKAVQGLDAAITKAGKKGEENG